MGAIGSSFVQRHFTEREVSPNLYKKPTFDPMLGFPTGRKAREMIATKEEMIAAQIPLENRDYCAHLLLDYMRCFHDWYPFMQRKCGHVKHVYLTCQYEDFLMRMKEYERERRMKKRDKRMKEKCRDEMISDDD